MKFQMNLYRGVGPNMVRSYSVCVAEYLNSPWCLRLPLLRNRWKVAVESQGWQFSVMASEVGLVIKRCRFNPGRTLLFVP
uniref:Uncharacterized protein n=1 Tax=Anguilla anguilla TaxID=7936 RepID=A0A0E9V7N5_ANGAN